MKEKINNAKALVELNEKIDAPYGYGCVYFNKDNGYHTDYQFHITPSNIANFLGKYMDDADKIIITDVMDNLICEFEFGFIMTCPDQKLLSEILPHLIPIQQEEKVAEEIIKATKREMNDYLNEVDHHIGMTMY